MSYENMIETETITIDQTDGATANSITAAIDLKGLTLIGIYMPDTWSAASITFEVSHDGVSFLDMYDHDTGEYTVSTAAADRYIRLVPSDFAGVRWIKIRSGTGATPVTNNEDLILLKRPV